jgi:hypothetical protein
MGQRATAGHGPIAGFSLSMADIGPCALQPVDSFTGMQCAYLCCAVLVSYMRISILAPTKVFFAANKVFSVLCI